MFTNAWKTLLLASVLTCSCLPIQSFGQDATEVKELRFDPDDESRSRTVPVKIYLIAAEKPQPVILFSHGLGGSRENSVYLAKHWAAAGYVAVFMQHAGSDEDVWKSAPLGKRLSALKSATGAKAFLDRLSDVSFVIDQLDKWNRQKDHPLHGRIDLEHIGMSGHSFGAATTLGVAGRKYPLNRSFAEDRIDAFFAMSPQAGKNGFSSKRAFGHLTKPILCMTGTKDGSPIDPNLNPESRREVYAALPKGDKYQLVLKDAQHSAFGDSRGKARTRDPKHHPAIQKISLHFWNAYLKNGKQSKEWLQSTKPITEAGLVEGEDAWEWK